MKHHPYQDLRNLSGIQYATVARDSDWFLSFPDVAITDRLEYLCVYTRASFHGGSRRAIMLARSLDGSTWGNWEVIGNPRNARYTLFRRLRQLRNEWDCPKIMNLGGGKMEISVALSDVRENASEPMLYRFKSTDDGKTWQSPISHLCKGIMQDAFIINPRNPNEWLVGIHCKDEKTGVLKQQLYRSLDGGISWGSPEIIAFDGKVEFCEVSIIPVPNSHMILAFMRDNRAVRTASQQYKHGFPSQFCVSSDFGRHWTPPIEIPINGHRPVAKFLQDGRIMVTYRDICDLGVTGLWIATVNAKNLEKVPVDFGAAFPNQKYYIIEREDQNNMHGDNGYTGWTQNPIDKNVVIVYYTKLGAPYNRAYIKSVKFNPSIL